VCAETATKRKVVTVEGFPANVGVINDTHHSYQGFLSLASIILIIINYMEGWFS